MKKRLGLGYAASCLFPVIAFAVLMLRLAEPHTRSTAIGLYLLGCLSLGLALASHARLRRQLRHAKSHALAALEQRGLLKKRAIGALAFFSLSLVLFPAVLPLDKTDLFRADPAVFSKELRLSEAQLEASVVGLQAASAELDGILTDFHLSDANQRRALKETWATYLDHALVLEQMISTHKHFAQLAWRSPSLANQAFLIGYRALVTQIQLGNQLDQRVANRSHVEALLNEQAPELGLPANTYLALRRGLSRAQTLVQLELGYGQLKLLRRLGKFESQKKTAAQLELAASLTIRKLSRNPDMILDTNFDRFESHAFEAWFPLQKGAAELISPVRTRHRTNFIQKPELDWVRERLEPGDILLERRNWYLTNAGIPGFWPHAALYVGTPSELDAYFPPEARAATLGMAPSRYLQQHMPEVYAAYGKLDHEGHAPRVIEAIGKGVVLESLETSGHADYLAGLRPRFSRARKLAAVIEAYRHFRKPYDYNFDFSTDDALFCSELVYKALSGADREPGISLPLLRKNGRYMLPPNDIARVFDEQYQTEKQQLDFVFFLDGNEAKARATFNDENAFRNSWRRPKWDLMQP